MSESDGLAFDPEFYVNCDALPSHDVPEDIWFEPLSVEPLAHFRHDSRQILGITGDFNRIHHLRSRQEIKITVGHQREKTVYLPNPLGKGSRTIRTFPLFGSTLAGEFGTHNDNAENAATTLRSIAFQSHFS
jgi:hypothetical protein